MPIAASERWPAGRMLISIITGAVGLFIIGGCRSTPSESDWRSTDVEWTTGVGPEDANVADDSAAVLFIEFVGTPQDVVDKMLEMAHVTKDDVVCDLGCGDGRIVVTAAKRYGCRAIGYDLDRMRVAEARENAEQNGVADMVAIEQKDVQTVDLRGATVVTLYMGREMNARLIPQLRTLPPGARIVSHNFGLANLRPDKTTIMTSRYDKDRHTIYFWRCPLPAAPK